MISSFLGKDKQGKASRIFWQKTIVDEIQSAFHPEPHSRHHFPGVEGAFACERCPRHTGEMGIFIGQSPTAKLLDLAGQVRNGRADFRDMSDEGAKWRESCA
ncbi:MAG: hypothetical protein FWH34_06430 [Desulfovibrionaceae bacterium]|nr:hypothetical protein [Desulfovibrionaceae bacterium]